MVHPELVDQHLEDVFEARSEPVRPQGEVEVLHERHPIIAVASSDR